jgi:choline dehydrogenase-like flavoprotein
VLEPLSQATSLERSFDVCIVGAGAAGITLAETLAAKGRSVVLAEAGALEFTQQSQELYRGQVVGDTYFDLAATRLRFFGGTTNHWGGLCRRLETHDFEAKRGSNLTRWPISRADLDPYAASTAEILEVEEQREDRRLDDDLSELFWEFSPPVRFGLKYERSLRERPNVLALTECNFVGADYDGSRLTGMRFKNYSGTAVTARAKAYVLACGGIENSRLLLVLNQQYRNRLGNQRDLVGRFWTEHPEFSIGDFFLFDYGYFETPPRIGPSGRPAGLRVFVGPTAGFLERSGTLSCNLRLLPLYERTGAKKYLAEVLCLAPDLANTLLSRFGERVVCAGRVDASWEQIPDADNRVVITGTRDAFGLPTCALHWKKSAADKRAPRMVALALGAHLAQRDVGRIRLDDWIMRDDTEYPNVAALASNHHMGGTRMAASDADGVVDPNCRVFGTGNLYVAGSSVFPSGGHANPTFTIVQLALRLADHLDGAL